MSNDTDQQGKALLADLQKYFSEILALFVASRITIDRACVMLRQIRSSMGLRELYEAILNATNGDDYIETERMLSKLEKGSSTLRSYILELEKSQLKKATKNPLIDIDLGPKYH